MKLGRRWPSVNVLEHDDPVRPNAQHTIAACFARWANPCARSQMGGRGSGGHARSCRQRHCSVLVGGTKGKTNSLAALAHPPSKRPLSQARANHLSAHKELLCRGVYRSQGPCDICFLAHVAVQKVKLVSVRPLCCGSASRFFVTFFVPRTGQVGQTCAADGSRGEPGRV
jgi:hypothetical protein